MDALQALLSRVSAARLAPDEPDPLLIEQILAAGLRAADHGRLRPWKFLVVRGGARHRFGELLADGLKSRNREAGAEMLEAERSKALRAPVIVIVMAVIRDNSTIPEIEQIVSAGAAAQNMPVASHALGLGGFWRTGAAAYEAHLFPELEYTFKHALTHEVAYASLLQERRLALHLRILEALERQHAAQPSEEVERLARHALGAESWHKAATYLRQAGRRAIARSSYDAAAGLLREALRALERLPETPDTLAQAIDVRFELRFALVPSDESDGDVPRDGHALLAGPSGGGDATAGMRVAALVAILGLHPRQTRATGGHSYTNVASPLSRTY